MRLRFSMLALALAGLQRLALAQAVPSTIPVTHGTLLNGTAVDLPAALQGKTGVLVIGFSQASRVQVSAWGKRLAGDFTGRPDVVWYEIGELEAVPRLLRGLVTKKIRESVSPQGQSNFLLVTDHEREWKLAADYKQPDDGYVVVVDESGTIRARTHGALTDAAYAKLRAVVAR